MTDPDIKARFTPHILDIRQSLARLEDERKSSNNPGMGVEQAVEEPPAGAVTLPEIPAEWVQALKTGIATSHGCQSGDCALIEDMGDDEFAHALAMAAPMIAEHIATLLVTTPKPAEASWRVWAARIAWEAFRQERPKPDGEPPAGDNDLHQQVANAIHYVMYGSGSNDSTRKLAAAAAHAALSVRDLEVEELRRNLATSRRRTEHFARLYSDALDELEDPTP